MVTQDELKPGVEMGNGPTDQGTDSLGLYRHLTPRQWRTLAWGVLWRWTAFMAGVGALLGAIYGLLYLILADLLLSKDPSAALLDAIMMGVVLGWVVGATAGLLVGAAFGLVMGAFSCGLAFVGARTAVRASQFRVLLAVLGVVVLVAAVALVHLQTSEAYTTLPHWLLGLGFPALLLAPAGLFVGSQVANWVISGFWYLTFHRK